MKNALKFIEALTEQLDRHPELAPLLPTLLVIQGSLRKIRPQRIRRAAAEAAAVLALESAENRVKAVTCSIWDALTESPREDDQLTARILFPDGLRAEIDPMGHGYLPQAQAFRVRVHLAEHVSVRLGSDHAEELATTVQALEAAVAAHQVAAHELAAVQKEETSLVEKAICLLAGVVNGRLRRLYGETPARAPAVWPRCPRRPRGSHEAA